MCVVHTHSVAYSNPAVPMLCYGPLSMLSTMHARSRWQGTVTSLQMSRSLSRHELPAVASAQAWGHGTTVVAVVVVRHPAGPPSRYPPQSVELGWSVRPMLALHPLVQLPYLSFGARTAANRLLPARELPNKLPVFLR